MPRYYYSENIGMKVVPDEEKYTSISFKTEDEAMLNYYITKRKSLLGVIYLHETRVRNENKNLDELDKAFEYLSDKFPEEFI